MFNVVASRSAQISTKHCYRGEPWLVQAVFPEQVYDGGGGGLLMSSIIKTLFGPGRWLGDGRYYVFAVLLPLACLAPWGLVTEAAPDFPTKGERWGVFSPVAIDLKPFDPSNLVGSMAIDEHVNRLFSASTATLLAIIAVAVTLMGLMIAWREIASTKDRIVFGCAWLLLIVVLISVMDPSRHGTRIIALLGHDVFDKTVGAIYGGKPLVLLKRLLMMASIIVVVGGATLAVAVTTLAASGSRLRTLDDLPILDKLRTRLDLILFASALVLGVGLIDMKQWQAWPLPFVVDAKQYEKLTNAFIAFQSVCYVGVLATLYLPTALVLNAARARIRRDAVAITAVGAATRSPANDGVTDNQASSLSSAVAPLAVFMRSMTVLSPLLVGPIATIVQLKLTA